MINEQISSLGGWSVKKSQDIRPLETHGSTPKNLRRGAPGSTNISVIVYLGPPLNYLPVSERGANRAARLCRCQVNEGWPSGSLHGLTPPDPALAGPFDSVNECGLPVALLPENYCR